MLYTHTHSTRCARNTHYAHYGAHQKPQQRTRSHSKAPMLWQARLELLRTTTTEQAVPLVALVKEIAAAIATLRSLQ